MGITPGSGPAHLSLFGYEPTKHILGRGILEALGVGIEVGENDLVARGNFATSKQDLIIDRRAGRIPTEQNEALCQLINDSLRSHEDLQVRLFPGKEHRFVIKFTGKGLQDSLSDADPQKDNSPMLRVQPLSPQAKRTAAAVNAIIDEATKILENNTKANAVLLRGFSKHPSLPRLDELYKLTPASIAHYPMYKGISLLVGMQVLDGGTDTAGLFASLKEHFHDFDFFYIHVKGTDSAGEDRNRDAKISVIEDTDRHLPSLLDLNPDVVCVTADHSTPCSMGMHSWHPNPVMIRAPHAFTDDADGFTERACSKGYLGRFRAIHIMPLLLAHAGKLKKFGA
jgi:2,3-bisphosphoglycerate-independent phosphoglycerate mutase